MVVESQAVRRAVIVAAGRSSRLYPRTLEFPKPLLEVGGEAMIRRSVRLMRQYGIEEIAVVVGFERLKIQEALRDEGIYWIFNPFFAQTNNLGSLWFANPWYGGRAFLYSHADIVYAPHLLARMLAAVPHDGANFLVDHGPTDEEAMKVRVDTRGQLVESNKEIPLDEAYGEWVGLTTFSAGITETLTASLTQVLSDELLMAYDTESFSRMAKEGAEFRIVPTEGAPWIEVDFESDYQRAQELFVAASGG